MSIKYSETETKEIYKTQLSKINDKPYSARFICAITYIDNERTIKTEGTVEGEIILEERGDNGFGYDPIFFLKEYNKTVAELPSDEKNKISHRHNALIKLIEELKKC